MGDPPLKLPLFSSFFHHNAKGERKAKREKKENRASANSQSQKSPQGRFQFFLSLCAFFNNLESMFSSSFLLFFFPRVAAFKFVPAEPGVPPPRFLNFRK